MSTDGMTNSSMMTTYLHFTPLADTLFFAGWVPETPGAIAGASIGLFLLALLERFVAACRPMMEIYWRAAADLQNKRDGPAVKRRRLRAPAFVPAHDIARGAMHAVQATLGFAIMLAVMCVLRVFGPPRLLYRLFFVDFFLA